jgi:Stage II sporulation protein M
MSEPTDDRGARSEKPGGAVAELLDRHRILLVLGIFLAELALLVVGLLTPLSSATLQTLANETSSQFGAVQSSTPVELVVFIFSHNLSIAIVEMIPIFGAFLFVLSVYSTGLAAQAVVVSQGLPSQLGIILLAFPYSLVELSAYAMSVGAGVMLAVSWRRRRLRRELRVFLLEAMLIAGVLLAAAAMETLTKFSPLIGFALWLPTGLTLAGVVLLSARYRT